LIVANLVEGPVEIGRVLSRHVQHPLTDEIALHFVASTGQTAPLPVQVSVTPFAAGVSIDPRRARGSRQLQADVEPTLIVDGRKEPEK
jgi:hypothetical protein